MALIARELMGHLSSRLLWQARRMPLLLSLLLLLLQPNQQPLLGFVLADMD
jgi:hypothetical protein